MQSPTTRGRRAPGLAGRMGRWSARHRRIAILGWIAFVVAAYMVGGNIGTQNLSPEESGVGDSGRAARIAADAYPAKVGESVVIRSDELKATDAAFRSTVGDVTQRLKSVDGVQNVHGPYDEREPSATSNDGHAVLIGFEVAGGKKDAAVKTTIDATLAATAASQKAHPGYTIEQFGAGSSEDAVMALFNKDLKKATTMSLPVTLIILALAFGTLVAAGVPLLLGITAVLATLGLIGPLSQLSPVEETIHHVVLLIGLAVGVDYALFYLRRMREERAAGRSSGAALEAAAATSGHAVLVSGLTVMIAMAGMYFSGAATFTSFATGTIVVVAVAVLGSLTVLPAVLSKLGDRTERGRVPGLSRLRGRLASVGIWSHIVDRVLRRPAISAALATAVLVALAIPAIGLDTGTPNTAASLPQDEPVVQTFNHLQDWFPQETSSLDVVVKAKDVTDPAVAQSIAELQERATGTALLPGDEPGVDISPDKTVATVSVEIAGDGTDDESNRALDYLRSEVVPPTVGSVPGVEAYVGGGTAVDADFNDTMKSHLPYVFGFVLTAAFLLLLVTFRSVVVPLKAIVLNLLSVAATYGLMVLVFQHGFAKELLGFTETGPITSWVPLFLFVILFGLSMDYHVFILSRIREAYDRGMGMDDAVAHGIKTTAGVVTSAAAVMVAVFAIFGSLSFVMFKQMGVGLAFAVLLDATIVRAILLPATMKLLGERNWWLPKRLGWLPRFGHRAESQPAAA